ncbi:response regulator [Pelagicoccus albus]|uniref:Response regulator n=1 Tax=Pelagicoccus albus TaxID=415222 RepID=A0A7X1B586_9BACT|nr:response regulator [Pelagicoccus albus]MBC2605881.1 response regulator [Pelagicoccus albus]
MRKCANKGQLELWKSPASPNNPEKRSSCATSTHQPAQKAPRFPAASEEFSLNFEDTRQSPPKRTEQSFAQKRPLRILVADDNDINRKVIRIILSKLGYECHEAENGREALEAYRSGDFNYVFMDIDMPEMDGLESTLAIRSCEADSRKPSEIIAVTANVSQETRLKCRRAGMNGYLEKPITAEIIKEQLLRSWPRVRSRG